MEKVSTDFNWREQNSYRYSILNNDTFCRNIKNLNTYKNCVLCIYTVNNENKYPFLQFLFYKSLLIDSFSFLNYINFHFNNNDNFIQNINEYILSFLNKKNIFSTLNNNDNNDFIHTNDIIFDGYIEEEENNYLFLHIPKLKDFIFSKNLQLGLIDEIVNYQRLDDKEIDADIVEFFQRNNDLLYLKSETNETYETPMIAYVTKTKKQVEFTRMFGEMVQEGGILGNYYYFTNYETAKKREEEMISNKEYGCGIVKFALFPGIMKTFLLKIFLNNNYLKEIDEQEMKDWIDLYDSCYYLENGKDPIWVIKDFSQQVPLCVCK